MNRYKRTFAIFASAIMLLSLAVVASAQRRGNDDYYGNRRNNTNLRGTVRNLQNNSRSFEKALDRELDRSRYDGSDREDRLNNLAKNFKNAADDLEDDYNRRNQRRSADEARKVLQLGSQLDRALSRSRIAGNNYQLQNLWNNIERDLQLISRAYNLNYNGVYGRNRGNNDRSDRNRNRNRNDRGNNRNDRRNNQNLRSTIVNLKNNARQLENNLDRYDNDNDDNYGRGRNRSRNRSTGNLEGLSDRFKKAVDKLEDEYDNRRDYNDSADEVRNVLQIGQQLDRAISQSRVDSRVTRQWNRIESDLRVLANAYNISYNGNNNRNGRFGGILDNLPF